MSEDGLVPHKSLRLPAHSNQQHHIVMELFIVLGAFSLAVTVAVIVFQHLGSA
jgi:hypothetical protein